jgi:hypothetical protein
MIVDQPATATPRTERRWFKFSLKTLLVVMTVIAVCLVLYLKQFRARREAIATIERLGGEVAVAPSYAGLYLGPEWIRKLISDEKYFWEPVGVRINSPISDDELEQVMRRVINFERIYDLSLFGTSGTDNALALVRPLGDNLLCLRFYDTDISDAAIVHLKQLPMLKSLVLNGTSITPAGIAELQAALPNCIIEYRWPRIQ